LVQTSAGPGRHRRRRQRASGRASSSPELDREVVGTAPGPALALNHVAHRLTNLLTRSPG